MSSVSYPYVLQHIEDHKSPAKVGAFFDFDETIIDGFSALIFIREQLKKGYLKPHQFVKVVTALVNLKMGLSDFSSVMEVGAEVLTDVNEQEYAGFAEKIFHSYLEKLIYPEARALIQAHQDKGHTVAIVTSATPHQVQYVAKSLNVEHVLCSHYEIKNGLFSGRLEGPVCWGEGKLKAITALAKKHKLSLSESYFYSDSDDDLPALNGVGHPRAINPNERLQLIASDKGWPVQIFARLGKPSLLENIKSLGVYGALIGAYFGGWGVWKANGSIEEGQRFMLSLFTDIAFPLMKMQVKIKNPQNFWIEQPVLVIFNHQSQADGLVIMKLLKDNFAAIGKKEIGRFKLFAKAYEFAGVIPIDRADTQSAIDAMKPLVDALVIKRRNVAIAPEGTRSESRKPGPFKKGAFHVAMQAGVPVLPVVIHNAIDIQPKGQFAYRPGCINVEILEPVATTDWTKENMGERINDVRNMFLTALGYEKE